MHCAFVPFRGWMGKTLRALEQGMVVGAKSNGLCVSRTATLLSFSSSTVSCVYQEWSTTQRTSSQLMASIGVNMGQHPCEMLSTPCSPCPYELRLSWGQKGVQLNILKVFIMFCTLCTSHLSPYSAYTQQRFITNIHLLNIPTHTHTNKQLLYVKGVHMLLTA